MNVKVRPGGPSLPAQHGVEEDPWGQRPTTGKLSILALSPPAATRPGRLKCRVCVQNAMLLPPTGESPLSEATPQLPSYGVSRGLTVS